MATNPSASVSFTPEDFAASIEQPSRQRYLTMDGYFVWDGSLIRDERGKYQLYASRWPVSLGFRAWLTDSHVIRAEADSLDGPFVFQEQLDGLNQQAWCREMTHNPRVYRLNDRYYLYYIGTCWQENDPARARAQADEAGFEEWTAIRFRQRIGLATADHAAGPWTPCETNPILHPRPDAWDCCLTVNPEVFQRADGRIQMIYKSSSGPREPLLLGAAIADHPQGPFERIGPSPLMNDDIEDPCVWRAAGEYRMLVKDMTGDVCGRRNAGVLYRSDDALHWQQAGDKPAYDLRVHFREDDEPCEVRYVERPLVYVENGQPCCLLNAVFVEPDTSGVLVRRLQSSAGD